MTTTEFLIVGGSPDDIRLRFPYLIDLADFERYRLDYIVKEPSRAFTLKTKSERLNASNPDQAIKREDGTLGIFQHVKNDPDAHRYLVHAETTCYAKNEKSAVKKLASRIQSGSENLRISVEEVAANSGFAMPRDQSVFMSASFVRG
jgi:hypothetical protein